MVVVARHQLQSSEESERHMEAPRSDAVSEKESEVPVISLE